MKEENDDSAKKAPKRKAIQVAREKWGGNWRPPLDPGEKENRDRYILQRRLRRRMELGLIRTVILSLIGAVVLYIYLRSTLAPDGLQGFIGRNPPFLPLILVSLFLFWIGLSGAWTGYAAAQSRLPTPTLAVWTLGSAFAAALLGILAFGADDLLDLVAPVAPGGLDALVVGLLGRVMKSHLWSEMTLRIVRLAALSALPILAVAAALAAFRRLTDHFEITGRDRLNLLLVSYGYYVVKVLPWMVLALFVGLAPASQGGPAALMIGGILGTPVAWVLLLAWLLLVAANAAAFATGHKDRQRLRRVLLLTLAALPVGLIMAYLGTAGERAFDGVPLTGLDRILGATWSPLSLLETLVRWCWFQLAAVAVLAFGVRAFMMPRKTLEHKPQYQQISAEDML